MGLSVCRELDLCMSAAVSIDKEEARESTWTMSSHSWTMDRISEDFPIPRHRIVSTCNRTISCQHTFRPSNHDLQLAYILASFRERPSPRHADARHYQLRQTLGLCAVREHRLVSFLLVFTTRRQYLTPCIINTVLII